MTNNSKNNDAITRKHPSSLHPNSGQNHSIPQNVTAQISFTSPLPPAEILSQYERLGLKETVVSLIEENGKHRRSLETHQAELQRLSLEGQINHQKRRDWEAKLGQIFALIISLSLIIGGIVLVWHGSSLVGSLFGIGGLTPLVGHFIHGSKKENK